MVCPSLISYYCILSAADELRLRFVLLPCRPMRGKTPTVRAPYSFSACSNALQSASNPAAVFVQITQLPLTSLVVNVQAHNSS